MKIRRIVCLLLSLVMMLAMSTTTADAASFKSQPTGVKAKCVSGVSVSVSCKTKKRAAGYCFYYATSLKGKYKLGATSKKRFSKIKGLIPGKTYYFKVRAFKLKRKGKTKKYKRVYTKLSKPVRCKVVLKAPQVMVSTECCCKINLQMTKATGATGFVIYRSTNRDSGYTPIKKTKATTWQDTGLSGSTTYYYKVRMYRGSYYSPPSSAKSAVTLANFGDGNDVRFDPENNSHSSVDASVFAGRNLFFLGSSITYGSASGGVSFVDFIAVRNGYGGRSIDCVALRKNNAAPEPVRGAVWKEAVSGTTMARETGNLVSYSYRLHEYYSDTQINPDEFVCQLSLNDVYRSIPLGSTKAIDFTRLQDEETSDAYLESLYNNSFTVAGAIEYITAFAYAKWPGCQVVFYTVSKYSGGMSDYYNQMVSLLYKEASSNNIAILDLWNDPTISAWTKNYLHLYMADLHHPKKAGYLEWTPLFELFLADWMPEAVPDEPEGPEEPDDSQNPDGTDDVPDAQAGVEDAGTGDDPSVGDSVPSPIPDPPVGP